MKILPQDDMILIEPIQRRHTTPAGVIVPEAVAARTDLVFSRVIAVGQGGYDANGKRISIDLKEGQIIITSMGAGMFDIEYDAVILSDKKRPMPKRALIVRNAVLAVAELEDGESLQSPIVEGPPIRLSAAGQRRLRQGKELITA